MQHQPEITTLEGNQAVIYLANSQIERLNAPTRAPHLLDDIVSYRIILSNVQNRLVPQNYEEKIEKIALVAQVSDLQWLTEEKVVRIMQEQSLQNPLRYGEDAQISLTTLGQIDTEISELSDKMQTAMEAADTEYFSKTGRTADVLRYRNDYDHAQDIHDRALRTKRDTISESYNKPLRELLDQKNALISTTVSTICPEDITIEGIRALVQQYPEFQMKARRPAQDPSIWRRFVNFFME